jgi:hypothetical protein
MMGILRNASEERRPVSECYYTSYGRDDDCRSDGAAWVYSGEETKQLQEHVSTVLLQLLRRLSGAAQSWKALTVEELVRQRRQHLREGLVYVSCCTQ